uniref:Cullin N-terminal domain-containing protein n=1 Tax=Oryza barthii TaxID=65489 RepID=A0A0D3G0T8_9ORYZ
MTTRSQIQPLPFRRTRMDAALAASSCQAVTDAIRDIYAQDMEKLNFEQLYRRVYEVVLNKHGELMYSEVATALTAEVEGLRTSLVAVADGGGGGGAFLRELLSKWRRHTEAVAAVRDMVMYMERTFVVTYRKVSVQELGVKLWRDGVVCSGDVMPRLVEAVRRERAAAAEPGELMAGVAEMLTKLGDKVLSQVMTRRLSTTIVAPVWRSLYQSISRGHFNL